MAHKDSPRKAEGERVRAVKRLNEVVAERSHMHEMQGAAGTSREVRAAVLLRAADEQVVARERWLEWVDEQGD